MSKSGRTPMCCAVINRDQCQMKLKLTLLQMEFSFTPSECELVNKICSQVAQILDAVLLTHQCGRSEMLVLAERQSKPETRSCN